MAEQERNSNAKKGGKTGIVIGVVVVVIVIIFVLLGIIIYLLRGRAAEPEPESIPQTEQAAESDPEQEQEVAGQRNVLVTEENVNETLPEIPDTPVAADKYTVTMNTNWIFKDGSSPSSNSYVANVWDNSYPVYFDIYLADTKEVIYESPVLPLGQHIDGIKLDKDLDAGTYDCVMTYHLVDDDQKTLSTVNVGLTINVTN